tara:strand:+ start:210 stop:950 length:741 start_codon:yes stop_codon:yes gene_type:complete
MTKIIIGVYKISNKICHEEKYYIGYSRNIINRWNQHRYDLKMNKHCNPHLQNYYNKHGPDCFNYEILHECENEIEAQKLELYYLENPNIRNELYNVTFSNSDGILYHSEDSIQRMKQSQIDSYKKGRKVTNKRSVIIDNINYSSIKEAHIQLGVPIHKISYCLKSDNYLNYKYADNINEISEETRTKKRNVNTEHWSNINNFKSIVIDDVIYKSISEAARELKTCRSTIYSRLNSPKDKFANYKLI